MWSHIFCFKMFVNFFVEFKGYKFLWVAVCVGMMEEPSLKPNLWSAPDKSSVPLSFLWIIPIVLSIFLSPTDESGSKRLLPVRRVPTLTFPSHQYSFLHVNNIAALFETRILEPYLHCSCFPFIPKKMFCNSPVPLKTLQHDFHPPDINPPVQPPLLADTDLIYNPGAGYPPSSKHGPGPSEMEEAQIFLHIAYCKEEA